MQLLKKQGLLIFWGVLLLDCYFIYSGNNHNRLFTKLALVPVLLFYIFLNTKKNVYRTTKSLVFFAFVAAWIGDLLLLNSSKTFFLFGMLCFAIFHILMAATFYRMRRLNIKKGQFAFMAAIVYAFISFNLIKFLKTDLGELLVPVIGYIIIMGAMVVSAFNLLENNITKPNAITFFIPAALLFIISDTTLALQTFKYQDESILSIIVMLSYGYSISLLGDGFSKYLKG
jgi:uncharacterized membrane protein YhhN